MNDQLSLSKKILAEWSSKNTLNPESVSPGSDKKAIWLCSKNHEYETSIYNKVRLGRGCPYCAGKKVLKGFNDLNTTHPELVKQWSKNNVKDSTEVSAGSNYKAEWICSKNTNHEWLASVSNRRNGTGCPFCSGRKVSVGDGGNNFLLEHSKLAEEWSNNNTKGPDEISSGSGYRAEWNCDKGHKWLAPIYSRVAGNGCPYCSGRKTLQGFNDLETTHPELIKYISKESKHKASEVSSGTSKKLLWICEENHSFSMEPHRIIKNNRWCPYCSGRKVLKGHNDLLTTHPILVKEWADQKEITAFSAGSTYKAKWICFKNNNHEWVSTINDRTRKDKPQGCPHCSNRTSKAEKELNDYIRALGFETFKDRKVLIGRELDIYIPKKNIAIEYNGLYWHTEEQGKDSYYHYNKWLTCKEAGVQLIQIWEDDYIKNPELIKKMVSHKLGASERKKVYARKTVIAKVNAEQARNFLVENHLQGYKSGEHWGLYEKNSNNLVSLMTFKRDNKNKMVYLERFATSCVVPGGFSKLLKYGVDKFSSEKTLSGDRFQKIVSFSAHDLSDGSVYDTNDFINLGELKPDYSYLYGGERKHKFGFRLKRFKDDPNLEYKEGLTEKQLAKLNSIPRIWDAGKTKWVKEL